MRGGKVSDINFYSSQIIPKEYCREENGGDRSSVYPPICYQHSILHRFPEQQYSILFYLLYSTPLYFVSLLLSGRNRDTNGGMSDSQRASHNPSQSAFALAAENPKNDL